MRQLTKDEILEEVTRLAMGEHELPAGEARNRLRALEVLLHNANTAAGEDDEYARQFAENFLAGFKPHEQENENEPHASFAEAV